MCCCKLEYNVLLHICAAAERKLTEWTNGANLDRCSSSIFDDRPSPSVTVTPAPISTWCAPQLHQVDAAIRPACGSRLVLASRPLGFACTARNYTVSQKKQDTKLVPITLPSVNRFSIFFAGRLSGKLATNSYWNIPPHFKYVAALLCEIWMSENWQQSERCIAINDKSQGSIHRVKWRHRVYGHGTIVILWV